eukprot:TRINITY_DN6446_c0_g4_i1.p1 TRINITY_DN6446_c0_g4~~TRINITY_DN6446_c0_g4_i1.p1  ORF type:complete len:364 (+),score=70.20 TRINITY_DN6446_c0_g4_i1:1101-2192(+)
MGIQEKIKDIEDEMARTQKNKATEHHFGLMKARLARLRAQLLEPQTKGGKGEGFEVQKSGDARVCIVGFPSVGKSTMLTKLTETASEISAVEFTTLSCIPGVLRYKGANIQLLDTPGIIEGASQGKGRHGRQVLATVRTADLIVIMLDPTREEAQKRVLERELEAVGVRLNKQPPDVTLKMKATGGVSYTSTLPLTQLDDKMIRLILHEYKIHNVDILFREDISVDQFIDVVEGKRSYIRCLYVYNKIDRLTLEEVEKFAERDNTVVISCEMDLNLEYLVEVIWQYLNLVRVYTKKRGEPPSLHDPLIMRQGTTIGDVCDAVHRDMREQFKYAHVWGTSAKHIPQRVGLTHLVEDEDCVEVHI